MSSPHSLDMPIPQATDFLTSTAPESLLTFCLAPTRTWNSSAVRAMAEVIPNRSDDPVEVGAAFAKVDDPGDRHHERMEELATLFAGKLGARTPPSVVRWLDFGSKHRNDVMKSAWEAFLAAQDPAFVREKLVEDPKERVALLRYAYDAELFRSLLRDPDWKGWVGGVGEEAIPEILASLAEDEHTPERRRAAVHSAVQCFRSGPGPLDPEEQATWEAISTHWRGVVHELGLVVDHWPSGTEEMLVRLGPEAAAAWLDAWDEADLDLTPRIRVFTFSSDDRQWRVIEDVAARKRRSRETGALTRQIVELPDPVAHVVGLAKKHDATEAQIELLREVFRKQKTQFQEALAGAGLAQ